MAPWALLTPRDNGVKQATFREVETWSIYDHNLEYNKQNRNRLAWSVSANRRKNLLFLLCFVSCGLCRCWILQQEEGTWGKSYPPHLCFYKWRNCQHFLEKGVLTHWDLTPLSCGSSPEEGSTEKAFLRKRLTITMLSGLLLHRLYRQAGQFSVCQARGSKYRRRTSEIISSGCLTLQKGKRRPRKTK